MKLKFKQSIASATFAYRPGQIIEVDDVWAIAFIAKGVAELADGSLLADTPTAKTIDKRVKKLKKGTIPPRIDRAFEQDFFKGI